MSASQLISDPLFRAGYDDAWAGRDATVEAHWEAAERSTYHRGYDFACELQNAGEPRMALARGGLPNSEAVALLVRSLSSAGVA